VSIVHGTTNTSDSIHLQAARRTPREDLELCFSDGACRHSLALTQYTTVLHYCVAFNPPSRILEVENVDSKQHLLHCLLPLTAPSLRKPAAITEDVLSYRSMTGRHCFRNRTWSCENITLVWCSASLALSVPHGFNAAEVMGTLACRMERIREHSSCRSQPQPPFLYVWSTLPVIWSIIEGGL
ncbi:hypothetical protein CNYM01_11377, partial [Colletotrichum nymphaeae SA-01]